jgi:hypothetical protein
MLRYYTGLTMCVGGGRVWLTSRMNCVCPGEKKPGKAWLFLMLSRTDYSAVGAASMSVTSGRSSSSM